MKIFDWVRFLIPLSGTIVFNLKFIPHHIALGGGLIMCGAGILLEMLFKEVENL